MLLTADWHLDDNPANEYRWGVFDHVHAWLKAQGTGPRRVFILGDLTDRKDRHTGALVNRLVDELAALAERADTVHITMGNHDMPLNGTPFWHFLNNVNPRLSFQVKPFAFGDILLLPYSDNPVEEWKDIPFKLYNAIFMHQTVTGAVGNNGIVLENNKMPSFPVKCKVYSGDIHTTQTVKRVTYIGAPHPVAFGDDYPPQMFELDDNYSIARVIKCATIQKLMLRVRSIDELAAVETQPGDQVRVAYALPIAQVEQWPALLDAISSWAEARQVVLFSAEPDIEGMQLAAEEEAGPAFESDPAYILRLFADAENIDDRMFEAGIELLKECM